MILEIGIDVPTYIEMVSFDFKKHFILCLFGLVGKPNDKGIYFFGQNYYFYTRGGINHITSSARVNALNHLRYKSLAE